MSTDNEPPTKKPRAYGTACQFCRRRKLRCDTAQPACSNCVEHNQACDYARQAPPQRPTRAAIESLRRENELLRRLMNDQATPSKTAAALEAAGIARSNSGEGDAGSNAGSATGNGSDGGSNHSESPGQSHLQGSGSGSRATGTGSGNSSRPGQGQQNGNGYNGLHSRSPMETQPFNGDLLNVAAGTVLNQTQPQGVNGVTTGKKRKRQKFETIEQPPIQQPQLVDPSNGFNASLDYPQIGSTGADSTGNSNGTGNRGRSYSHTARGGSGRPEETVDRLLKSRAQTPVDDGEDYEDGTGVGGGGVGEGVGAGTGDTDMLHGSTSAFIDPSTLDNPLRAGYNPGGSSTMSLVALPNTQPPGSTGYPISNYPQSNASSTSHIAPKVLNQPGGVNTMNPFQFNNGTSLAGMGNNNTSHQAQPPFDLNVSTSLPSDSHLRSHLSSLRAKRPRLTSAEKEAARAVAVNELKARAAEGRHMERIHQFQARLDFDGWNPDLVMHLLQLHWNRQHHAFLITYRPSFMRDMACNGPFFSKLLLNAILYGVAKFTDHEELTGPEGDRGIMFLERAKQLLGESLAQPRITTIQALLLLCNSLGAQGHATSGSMMYCRIALAMITELGLNCEEDDARSSPESVEIKRRVVWAAFVLDKLHSLYQGRATFFSGKDMHVQLDLMDDFEELEQWSPYAYPVPAGTLSTVAYSVSTFKALCRLSVIIDRVITHIYTEKNTDAKRSQIIAELDQDLIQWFDNLPPHIAVVSSSMGHHSFAPTPMMLTLNALYHALIIVLHRPAVESARGGNSTQAASSWARCVTAARQCTWCLMQYRDALTLRRAPYMISYTTYVASTVHVRAIAAAENSDISHATADDSRALLAVCLDALSEGALVNAGVGRAQAIIKGLMVQMGVSLHTPPVRPAPLTSTPMDENIDIDMIIRSFYNADNQNMLATPSASFDNTATGMSMTNGGSNNLDFNANALALGNTDPQVSFADPLLGYIHNWPTTEDFTGFAEAGGSLGPYF